MGDVGGRLARMSLILGGVRGATAATGAADDDDDDGRAFTRGRRGPVTVCTSALSSMSTSITSFGEGGFMDLSPTVWVSGGVAGCVSSGRSTSLSEQREGVVMSVSVVTDIEGQVRLPAWMDDDGGR
jgi:hypothetical protein